MISRKILEFPHSASLPAAVCLQFHFSDVWWLYDDGGLTLLLPYILTTRKQYKTCKLRVFILANRSDQLDNEQTKFVRLLAKFRIDASDVIVIPDVTKKAEATTKAEFDQMISGCDITKDELNNEREKTNRYVFKVENAQCGKFMIFL